MSLQSSAVSRASEPPTHAAKIVRSSSQTATRAARGSRNRAGIHWLSTVVTLARLEGSPRYPPPKRAYLETSGSEAALRAELTALSWRDAVRLSAAITAHADRI